MTRQAVLAKRGFCPSAWTPLAAGDGLLVRVRAGVRPLTSAELRQIARLSRAHGSGELELTRRGNLQLRGVREASLSALRAGLIEAGLAAADAAQERRLSWLLCDALSSLEPGCAELEPVAGELAALVRGERLPATLPAKLSIVLDGGCVPADVRADLRILLSARAPERARLWLPGPGAGFEAVVARERAVESVCAIALAFARVAGPGSAHVGALDEDAHAALRAAVPSPFARSRPSAPRRVAALELGLHAGSRAWLAFALPFGVGDVARWEAIADLCDRHGDGTLRTTPARTLLMPLAAHGEGRAALGAARDLELVLDPRDPLAHVVACAGAPACASARGTTRDFARALASAVAPLLGGGGQLHVSGCEKSCAHHGAAAITLVCAENGAQLATHAGVAEAAARPVVARAAVLRRLTAWGSAGTLPAPMARHYEYERDGAEIYRRSFAIIRSEAQLARFSVLEERVAVRMIHTSGMVDLTDDLVFTPGFAEAARSAIQGGAPILCDAKMIVSGMTRARMRGQNEVLCFLDDPSLPALARALGTTRSAAALSFWAARLEGAVVAIGNAPTALFRLLELLDETAARPRAVIAVPVGFVGAAESKEAVLADGRVPAMIVRGRRGGSALAVAAIHALASDQE